MTRTETIQSVRSAHLHRVEAAMSARTIAATCGPMADDQRIRIKGVIASAALRTFFPHRIP